MNKLTLLIILFCSSLNAQVISNNTISEGSVAYPNGTVSFNTSGGILSSSYYKYSDSTKKFQNFLFGASLSAKNNEGIAKLFDNGSFAPEGKFNARFGYSWKNSIRVDRLPTNLQSDSEYIMSMKNLQNLYESDTKDAIKEIIKDSVYEKEILKLFMDNVDSFCAVLKKQKEHVVEKNRNDLDRLISQSDILYKNFENDYHFLLQEKKKGYEYKLRNTRFNQRHTVYVDFGMYAVGFKQYSNRDTLNLSNNFNNKQYEGANIRMGYNFKLGSFLLFGTSVGYRKWNNLELLSSKEYQLKTSTTSGNTTLTTEKKITAFSGTSGQMNQAYIQADLVWFIADKMLEYNFNQHKKNKFQRTTQNIFGINPYFNYYASDNKTVYPNVANIGLNVFVFKPNGVFSGGIFVELPDIQNNLEKMKDEPNLRPPYTRLSFGLVGKLSIGSLISPNF